MDLNNGKLISSVQRYFLYLDSPFIFNKDNDFVIKVSRRCKDSWSD